MKMTGDCVGVVLRPQLFITLHFYKLHTLHNLKDFYSATVPSDKYIAEITKSELKATKAGDGSYLEIEYTILEGEYKGRKVWDRLCLNHQTQKTVEIARANLSAICHAVGVIKPHDSSELHHIPLTINVKTRKDDSTGNIFNEIRGYSKRENLIPTTPPPTAAAQTPLASDPSDTQPRPCVPRKNR